MLFSDTCTSDLLDMSSTHPVAEAGERPLKPVFSYGRNSHKRYDNAYTPADNHAFSFTPPQARTSAGAQSDSDMLPQPPLESHSPAKPRNFNPMFGMPNTLNHDTFDQSDLSHPLVAHEPDFDKFVGTHNHTAAKLLSRSPAPKAAYAPLPAHVQHLISHGLQTA